MSTANRFHDRYGLTLTANGAAAVECYLTGVDRFLSADVGAQAALTQAIEADEGFATAYATQALVQQFQGFSAEATRHVSGARTHMQGTMRRLSKSLSGILDQVIEWA